MRCKYRLPRIDSLVCFQFHEVALTVFQSLDLCVEGIQAVLQLADFQTDVSVALLCSHPTAPAGKPPRRIES